MTKRNLSTIQCFKLIDNLQAVSANIDDAAQRLGLAAANDFKTAFDQVGGIIPPINGVIVKLMEQSQAVFKPSVPTQVVEGQILLPKYREEQAEFDLTDEEWAIADQWEGVYENVGHAFYDGMIES